MSDYIHKFNTIAQRNAATYSEPGVSLTKENELLEYNKIDILINGVYDYQEYDINFSITPTNNIPFTSINSITYQFATSYNDEPYL